MRTVYYMRHFVCKCGWRDARLTETPWESLPCPDCKQSVNPRECKEVETVKNIHPCHVAKGRTFPYFDDGLNVAVQSPSHKARLLKERGYVQVDSVHDRSDRPSKWRS